DASPRLRAKVVETLDLYTVPWPRAQLSVSLDTRWVSSTASRGSGNFLRCGRMHVERQDGELVAACRSGARCSSSGGGTRWRIEVPRRSLTGELLPEDVEDLIGLVL